MMSSIEFEESSETLSGTTPERKLQTGNLSSSIGAKRGCEARRYRREAERNLAAECQNRER